jgi:MFS family permease
VFGFFWGSWGAVLPLIQRHGGIDDGELGLALVWIGAGALVSLRVAGTLADRYPRVTLPAGVVLLGLSTAGPLLAQGTVAMSAACAGVGLCSGAADAAINAAGAGYETASGPVLNLGHGLFSTLVVAASLVVAVLVSGDAGSPWPLAVAGGLIVLTGLALPALGAPPVAARPRTRPDRPDRRGPDRPDRRGPLRILVVLGALGAVAYFVENAWQSWAAIQLHSTLSASAAVAAAGPAVFAACAASGRFAAHPVQHRLSPGTLLGAGAAVAAGGSALAAAAPSVGLGFAGIAVAGLGTSVCAPTLIAAAGRAVPAAPGAATSTVITLSYLGFVFGPALVGLVAQASSLRVALAAVAGAAGVLAVASRFLPR